MIQSYTYNRAQNLRQNFDALVSAYDIHYFTNIATQRENWQNLKKLIICAAKGNKSTTATTTSTQTPKRI